MWDELCWHRGDSECPKHFPSHWLNFSNAPALKEQIPNRYFTYKAFFSGESQGPLSHIWLRNIWSRKTWVQEGHVITTTNKFLERCACCSFLVVWWWRWGEGLSRSPCRCCFNVRATSCHCLWLWLWPWLAGPGREGMTVDVVSENLRAELFEKADRKGQLYALLTPFYFSLLFDTLAGEKKNLHS